jgi:iduronate 2-sulfatase
VPDPYRQIGTIDGSYGRISAAGVSSGKYGEIGLVYGWDKKPYRFQGNDDRDLLQGELHAQWAIEKFKKIANNKTAKPFFMGIGFVRPHTPLHAPDEYFDMYPIDEIELDNWLDGDELDTFWKENFQGELSLEGDVKTVYGYRGGNLKGPLLLKTLVDSYGGDRELALKYFLQAYLACITFVDDQVGKILDSLKSTGLNNNTIVILTSDHGWHLGEKNHLFKNSPWEESTRIPYILRIPNSEVKGVVNHPVSLIDIFPTLIDYCSLSGNTKKSNSGGNLGGYSLRAFLENPNTKNWVGPDYALTIIGNYGNQVPKEKQNYTLRTIDYRYIRYSNGKEELYHNKKDPYEWYNVVNDKKYIKKLKLLRNQLNQILK